MPEGDVKRLKEWGDEIKRRFAKALATTSGKGKKIEMKLDAPTEINHLIIQEDIRQGERIRKYKVRALVNKKWQTIAEGTAVGHKRIQMVEPVTCSRLQLIVEESIAEPQISNFAIYNVTE